MILDEFLWKLGFLADTAGAQAATAALANVSGAADSAAQAIADQAKAAGAAGASTAGAVNQAASDVGRGTGSIVASFGMWMAALTGVGAGIAVLASGLSSFIDDAISNVEDLDEEAGKSARSAVEEAKTRLTEAGEQITGVFQDIRRQAILTVLPYLGAIVSKIREWYDANRALIEGTLTKLKDVIGRIGGAIGNTVSFIAKVIDHTTGWKVALGLLAAGFIFLKRQMVMAAAAQGLALLMNPLTWIAAAIAAVILLVDDFMVYMEGGESLLGDFWKPFVAAIPGVKAWVQQVKDFIGNLLDKFSAFKNAVADAGGPLGYFKEHMLLVGSIGAYVSALLMGAFVKLSVFIGGSLLSAFARFAAFSMGVFSQVAMALVQVVSFLLGPVIKAFTALVWVVRAVGLAMMTNPILIVIAAIAAAVAGLAYLIYSNWDSIRDKTEEAWGGIRDVVTTTWGLIELGAAAVVGAIMAIFNPIVGFYSTLFGVIGDLITGNFEGAFNRVTALWDQTVGAIAAGVQKVIGFFTSIGQSLGLLNGKTVEIAQKVAVTASATPGAVAGAQNAARPQSTNPGASPRAAQFGGGQGGNVNQDVKMTIVTSDPEKAGKAAAGELRRQQQTATRNAGGATKL